MITKTTKSTGSSSGLKVQLTLEQHRFELHGSTYIQIFFNKYIGKFFGDIWQFEKTSI